MKDKRKNKANAGRKNGKKWIPVVVIPVALLLAVVLTGCFLWKNNETAVTLYLPEQTLTVEYGTEFTPSGLEADFSGKFFFREPLALPVRVDGEVDASVLGTYTLTCSADYTTGWLFGSQNFSQSKEITVQVVDTQPPVITLTEDPDGYTLPGHPYVEEGFCAVDGYDGDLTDSVIREVTETSVIYTVTDLSGNTATVERVIVFDDPTPPQLQLIGAADMSLCQGNEFTDPGWTASDNCEGDMTAAVQVTGTVDTTTPGIYTLHYSVTDCSGNIAEAVRTVEVMKRSWVSGLPMGDFGEPVQPEGKTIYLTFDDGPSQYTPELLKILEKYDIKATFFVVNTRYIEYVADIAAAGHQVGMHSTSHWFDYLYSSETAFFDDLSYIQQQIYRYTGRTPTIFRFPGGTSNTAGANHLPGLMGRLCATMASIGYRWFDWNVDSRDAVGARSADEVYQNVINGIGNKKIAVVLQHDNMDFTIDAVERIILWGLENGYTFAVLDTNSPSCQHGTRD